jgi:spectrin alpha
VVVQALVGSEEEVLERKSKTLASWQEFKENANRRRLKLEDSKRLQQFIRDCDELEAWISQKLQIATDDAHKDPTNLQVSVQ